MSWRLLFFFERKQYICLFLLTGKVCRHNELEGMLVFNGASFSSLGLRTEEMLGEAAGTFACAAGPCTAIGEHAAVPRQTRVAAMQITRATATKRIHLATGLGAAEANGIDNHTRRNSQPAGQHPAA